MRKFIEAVERGQQFQSLEDAFPPGPTEIWYAKSEFFRDASLGASWLEEKGKLPTQQTLKDTHILLGTTQEVKPEKIFALMQGENWSPRGEAYDLISNSGISHTSMSMGDVVVIDGQAKMIDSMGFFDL